jgi:hypothetical protein
MKERSGSVVVIASKSATAPDRCSPILEEVARIFQEEGVNNKDEACV